MLETREVSHSPRSQLKWVAKANTVNQEIIHQYTKKENRKKKEEEEKEDIRCKKYERLNSKGNVLWDIALTRDVSHFSRLPLKEVAL